MSMMLMDRICCPDNPNQALTLMFCLGSKRPKGHFKSLKTYLIFKYQVNT